MNPYSIDFRQKLIEVYEQENTSIRKLAQGFWLVIPECKLNYFFNQNIASDPHNTPRASGNLQQMQRLGLRNAPEDREILRNHLSQVLQTPNNVVKRFTKTFRDRSGRIGQADIEVRESLLGGVSGKFAKMKSSWKIMPDGSRKFVSAEFYGGG